MQFKPAPNNLKELRKASVLFNEGELLLRQQQTKLEKDIKQLEVVCASQFTQLQDQHEEIKKMSEKIVQQDLELEHLRLQEMNFMKLREQLKTKEQMIVSLEGQIYDLLKKIQAQADELLELKKNQKIIVEVKQTVFDDQDNETEALKYRCQMLENQLKEKQRLILKLQEKKRLMKQKYEKHIEQQNETILALQKLLDQLEKENEELKQLNKQLQLKNKKLMLELESLKAQIAVLTKAKDLDQSDIKHMIENNNLRNQKLHLQQAIAQLEYEISELKNSNALLIEKLKTAELQKPRQDQLANEVIALEKENEKLKLKNRGEQYQIEQQQQELLQKEQKLKDLAYELELKQISLHQTIKYTNGMKEENQALEEEIEMLKAQLKELRIVVEQQATDHEEEIKILAQKVNLEKVEANNRLINKIPEQIISPYQFAGQDYFRKQKENAALHQGYLKFDQSTN